MNILFLHGNYPAQFAWQVKQLVANPNHRVVFATERDPVAANEIPAGLQIVTLASHRPGSSSIHPYLQATEEAVLLGQAVVRELLALKQQGFQPDLVIFHAGRGLGLFLRQLLPVATLVAYCEWYFKPADLPDLAGRAELNSALSISLRNQTQLQELAEVDLAITPTNWQRQQYPASLQAQLQVVFDGIDTNYFQPATASATPSPLRLHPEDGGAQIIVRPEAAVLTYTTRGMEPLRGFPEFLRTVPFLLAEMPQLEVIIAGRDRVAYSYAAPTHNGSWKEHLLAELGEFPGRERVHFTGLIPYRQLRDLLQRTDLHVYFSRPYVTSWSLFQAAACGAPIAMNTGPATTGVLPDAALLSIDLDSPPIDIASALQTGLMDSLKRRSQQRRSLLPEELSLQICQHHWQTLLNKSLQICRQRQQVTSPT